MKRLLVALILFATAPLYAQQMHQRFPAATEIALTTQSSSIGATNLIASAPAGMYSVCWIQTLTRAASVSSSLLTTIAWNNGSAKTMAALSVSGGLLQLTADIANSLNSAGRNCIVIYSADSQAITYATTYGSVGGTTMQYSLYITVERLQ